MSQKVFGDVDLSVHVMRNPKMADGSDYFGLVFQVNCQDCETPTKIALQWNEVRTLLEGGSLNGVTRTQDGWIMAVQCRNSDGLCKQITQISISDEELEKHAQLEVTRRERNKIAGQRAYDPQSVAQRQPQMAPQRPPQVVRRPMPQR